jgi:hypothetical protein
MTAHDECRAVDLAPIDHASLGDLRTQAKFIKITKALAARLRHFGVPVTILLERDHWHLEWDRFNDGTTRAGIFYPETNNEHYFTSKAQGAQAMARRRSNMYGGPLDTLFGGPVDVPYTSAEEAARSGNEAIGEISSERGLVQYGYAGVPLLSLRNANLSSGPFMPEARIPPDIARSILADGTPREPFRAISNAAVSPGGGVAFTTSVVSPLAGLKFEYPAIYITVTAPALTAYQAQVARMRVQGVSPNGGPITYAAPGVLAPPGEFQMQYADLQTKPMQLLLFGATIVNAKPIPVRFCVAQDYTGFGGLLAPVTTTIDVEMEGLPDGAQVTVTAVDYEHPVMQELRRQLTL